MKKLYLLRWSGLLLASFMGGAWLSGNMPVWLKITGSIVAVGIILIHTEVSYDTKKRLTSRQA